MTNFLDKYEGKQPLEIFTEWFEEAKNNNLVADHTEINIATATKEGAPGNRIVLLKQFDERGFVFFTNYGGRKSKELIENPHASICIYWNPLGKQIRIEGKVEKISDAESDEYFASRPRESQIGAWTSRQSTELGSYEKFEKELNANRERFAGKDVPRPEFWGGWRVAPKHIEFWKAEEFRFHHRLVFERQADGSWDKLELYP